MSAVPSGGSIRSRFGRSAVPLITLAVGALAFAGFAVAKAVDSDPVVQRQVKVHAGLYELGTNTQDGTVWVAAVGSRLVEGARVVQLDGQTLEEKQSIDMDDAPGFGLAVNSRTGMLYTSNTRVGNMSAVNLETGEITIISDPDAEGEPHLYQVVADEENNMIYATVAQDPGQVWVVDGSTNTLDRVIETGGARPTGIVVDPAASRLYVSNMGDDFVSVIDLRSDEIVAKIPTVGGRSTRVAHDPTTNRLFVGNQASNDLSVIDLEEMRAVKRVAVGEQPVGVAFHAAANQVYVANRRSGTVSVVDAATYETVAELEIGTYPNSVYVDESTGLVYVTNKSARTPRGEEPTIDPNGDMVTIIRP